MRHWPLALLLLHAACTVEEAVPIEVPPIGDAQTLILVIEQPDEPTRLYAIDLSDTDAVTSAPYPADTATTLALLYNQPIADLGHASGELPLTDDDVTGRPLAFPDAIWSATFTKKEQSEWDEVTELPDRIIDLRVDMEESLDPCAFVPNYEIVNHTVDSTANGRGGAMLDDGRAFYSNQAGQFFTVTAEGMTPVALSTDTPSTGMFRAADGEIWLSGVGGRMARGHPDTGFVPAPTAPHVDEVRWLAGPRTTDVPFELFAMSSFDGAFSRFDGTSWTQIRPGPRIEAGGIAWLGEQHVQAAFASEPELLDWNRGTRTVENPNAGTVGLWAVDHYPGIGTALGTASGRVMHKPPDGDWTFIGELEFAALLSVGPFGDDGFVMGGEDGFLAFWRPNQFCITQLAPASILHIVPVGQDYMLVLTNLYPEVPQPPGGPNTIVTWLRHP